MKKYLISIVGTTVNLIFAVLSFVVLSNLYVKYYFSHSAQREGPEIMFTISCIVMGVASLFFVISCYYYYTRFRYSINTWDGIKYGFMLSIVSSLKYCMLVCCSIFALMLTIGAGITWLNITLCCVFGILYIINLVYKGLKIEEVEPFDLELDITGLYDQLDSHLKDKERFQRNVNGIKRSFDNLVANSKF